MLPLINPCFSSLSNKYSPLIGTTEGSLFPPDIMATLSEYSPAHDRTNPAYILYEFNKILKTIDSLFMTL